MKNIGGFINHRAFRLFAFLVFCVIAGMYLSSCHRSSKKDKDDMAMADMPIAVAYPIIDSVTLENVYPGNLVADREVGIMARVNGVVIKVHAPSGSKVKKGQLLYSIEDTKYRDAVAQAEASLATAKSDYQYYKSQYEAMEKAFKVNAVSEMELLQAKNNMEQSQAQIENYTASLKTARTMLSYCQIHAPFDGTLSLQSFDQDDYVNGEDNPVKLNTLYNDEIVHAYISIDESQYIQLVNNLEKGTFRLDSVPVTFTEKLPHNYYAKINYTAPEVNTSTGTVTLRFNLDNKYGELKSGMYMNVHLPYDVVPKAIIVRDASIGTDQLGKYLYLVNDSDRVVYTPIKVGPIYSDTLRIVNSGLEFDSRYVTEALLKVRDGMKVKPVSVNKPSEIETGQSK